MGGRHELVEAHARALLREALGEEAGHALELGAPVGARDQHVIEDLIERHPAPVSGIRRRFAILYHRTVPRVQQHPP